MSYPASTFTFIFLHIHIRKCRNFDLPSSSSVRNRSKNSLVSKKSFILVTFNHYSSFQNKLENLYHNISIYGKFKKKKKHFLGGHAQSGENLGTAVFFFL